MTTPVTNHTYHNPVNGERYRYIHSSLPPIPPSSYTPPASRESDKLYDVQLKVDQIKSVIHENIDKTIERGENIERLEEKAQTLEYSSNVFYRGARNLKCMFCKQNAKMIGCGIFALAIVIFVIVMIAKS